MSDIRYARYSIATLIAFAVSLRQDYVVNRRY